MNSLPSEPKQFVFGHMYSIKEQNQLIVEVSTRGLPTKLYRYAVMASLWLLNLISVC
jgi:hypothetical protein